MRVKTNAHLNRPISLFSWYNRPLTGKTTQSKNSEATQELGETAWQCDILAGSQKQKRDIENHNGSHKGKLGWAGCGTEFPTEGQTPRWRREVTHAVTAGFPVFLCQGWNLFSSHYRGPGTETLWKRKVFWAQMTVFSISLEPIPCKAQSSAQGTCWQALTLGSTTAKWKKLRMVPRRPFLSCSLQTTLSEYITLSIKVIQVET